MGHQFFERLAGKHMRVLQFAMAHDHPEPAVVADAGCKVVHNRVLQLIASGDLARLVAVVGQSVPNTDSGKVASFAALDMTLSRLRTCVYPDEAQRVALAMLVDRAKYENLDFADAIRAASSVFSEQLSRSEAVFRLPRDGPAAAQEMGDQLSIQMAERASTNLLHQYDKDPNGWRDNRWRAPRARAKKSPSEKLGSELDISS